MLTWRSGSFWALDASGPGSILSLGNTYVFMEGSVLPIVFFFSNYYLITEYIAGFKLFIVINIFDCHLQKMFSINPTVDTHAR